MNSGAAFEINADTNTAQFGRMPGFEDFAGAQASEVKSEQKKEGVADVLANVVRTFTEAVGKTSGTKDKKLITRCLSFGEKLVAILWNLTKQALNMAVQKFFIELCAMVIASLGTAWANRGNRPFDITTPGVFFNAPGSQPVMATTNGNQPSRSNNNQSPFGDPFSSWNSGSNFNVTPF